MGTLNQQKLNTRKFFNGIEFITHKFLTSHKCDTSEEMCIANYSPCNHIRCHCLNIPRKEQKMAFLTQMVPCLYMYVPPVGQEHWPTEKYRGTRRVSAELAASKGKKRGPYNR